ncbi:hypothetical protein Droror1_Dr00019852 [Drosera rotundifolia]
MAKCKHIDVMLDDRTPHKWIMPLTEDGFQSFISNGNTVILKVFGPGSVFSPMLFAKFFDPSDAFPLWDFEADVLLSSLRRFGHHSVDWSQTSTEYVLRAELPGVGEDTLQVCFERGKVLEISGMWKQQRGSKSRDWRSSHWWEHGYVRRIELPENTDWKKTEAVLRNDTFLEIKIPFKPFTDVHQGNSSE